MRSDKMKKGLEKAPHRSLFKAMGYTDEEIARPLVGVVKQTTARAPSALCFQLTLAPDFYPQIDADWRRFFFFNL